MNGQSRGVALAIAAAVGFGATIPIVKYLAHDLGAWVTAALLYTGAMLGVWRVGPKRETSSLPLGRLAVCALLGAALAPALLVFGLRSVDAASASLLLAFEAAFTVLLARILYRELLTRRLVGALVLMSAGGVVLLGHSFTIPRVALGSLAILGSVLFWAMDSALMRPLAELDTIRVVRGKASIGVGISVCVAIALRSPLPSLPAALGLVACGAVSYGVALQLYLLSQREMGAARTAAIFSTAPFFGTIASLLAGERTRLLPLASSAILLALGVALLIREEPAAAG